MATSRIILSVERCLFITFLVDQSSMLLLFLAHSLSLSLSVFGYLRWHIKYDEWFIHCTIHVHTHYTFDRNVHITVSCMMQSELFVYVWSMPLWIWNWISRSLCRSLEDEFDDDDVNRMFCVVLSTVNKSHQKRRAETKREKKLFNTRKSWTFNFGKIWFLFHFYHFHWAIIWGNNFSTNW